MTWVYDDHGNRCSVERWGSEDEARAALATLLNCFDCSDCHRCSNCQSCFNCSNCLGCDSCIWCTLCSNCTVCSRCTSCLTCNKCFDCYRSSSCSYCSNRANRIGLRVPPFGIPTIPDIHKSVYAAASNPGALAMEDWHTCNNTHCRAGWTVTLARGGGIKLEEQFGTALAAMMIYDASDPGCQINPCHFFDTNEEALADMKRLAGVE